VVATYGPTEVAVSVAGAPGRGLPRQPDMVDNDVSLELHRALPLRAGYSTRYLDVVPQRAAAVPLDVEVVGAEAVTVPAGTFPAWRVALRSGVVGHRAWYAREAPHLLLRYENPAGSTFALRSWQVAAGAPLEGSAAPAPPPTPPARIRPALIAVTLAVQLPLMIVAPLLLGRHLRRRRGVPWSIFGAGALTFVASQVVHIPLNWALGLLGAPRGLGLLPLPLLAVTAGLSAGLCEEVARWVALRFVVRRARGFGAALQFGAGHGGIEAIILGVLATVGLASMVVLKLAGPAVLGVKAGQLAQVEAAVDAYWRGPLLMPILGGLERIVAVAAHVAMTLLVMRAVVQRAPIWLGTAILAHAAVDGVALVAARTLGAAATEGVIAVLAVGLLAVALRARGPEPPAPDGALPTAPPPAQPAV